MEKRLYRSRSNRMIWGVCGGLAEYFNLDPTIVRVIFVLLLFASGVGILAYIILAIVVPLERSTVRTPRDVVRENVQEIKETSEQLGKDIQSSFSAKTRSEVHGLDEQHGHEHFEEGKPKGASLATALGAVVIIIGVLFLLNNFFGAFWLFRWSVMWPLILIAVGLLVIFGRKR